MKEVLRGPKKHLLVALKQSAQSDDRMIVLFSCRIHAFILGFVNFKSSGLRCPEDVGYRSGLSH